MGENHAQCAERTRTWMFTVTTFVPQPWTNDQELCSDGCGRVKFHDDSELRPKTKKTQVDTCNVCKNKSNTAKGRTFLVGLTISWPATRKLLCILHCAFVAWWKVDTSAGTLVEHLRDGHLDFDKGYTTCTSMTMRRRQHRRQAEVAAAGTGSEVGVDLTVDHRWRITARNICWLQ